MNKHAKMILRTLTCVADQLERSGFVRYTEYRTQHKDILAAIAWLKGVDKAQKKLRAAWKKWRGVEGEPVALNRHGQSTMLMDLWQATDATMKEQP